MKEFVVVPAISHCAHFKMPNWLVGSPWPLLGCVWYLGSLNCNCHRIQHHLCVYREFTRKKLANHEQSACLCHICVLWRSPQKVFVYIPPILFGTPYNFSGKASIWFYRHCWTDLCFCWFDRWQNLQPQSQLLLDLWHHQNFIPGYHKPATPVILECFLQRDKGPLI